METNDVVVAMSSETEAGIGNPGGCLPSCRRQHRAALPIPLRVIVIEKHPIILKSVAAMMQLLGYRISTAQREGDAIRQLRLAVYDLVLADFDMPLISGYQLGRLAKMRRPDTKVIIMTNFCQAEVVGITRHGGIDAWLFKPFGIAELERTLSNINFLDGHNLVEVQFERYGTYNNDSAIPRGSAG